MRHLSVLMAASASVCLALPVSVYAASASSLTVLASLYAAANGRNPSGSPLIADKAGNLYGTAYQGGTGGGNGILYQFNLSNDAITALVNFNTSSGTTPYGGVVADANFNLYGTTYAGAAGGDGTIYKVAPGTNKLTTLFTFNGSNGSNSGNSLTFGADGNLYGTTGSGGSGGSGTVFELNPTTLAFTTLVNFNGSNGATPNSKLTLDASGNLYGTTVGGGASGDGTVYKIAAAGHAFSTVVSFNSSTGTSPYTNVQVDPFGNLFGTTGLGGAAGVGTVFEIPAGTSTVNTLASFNSSDATPASYLLLDSHDNLFGGTDIGGTGGTVFKFDSASQTLNTLATLDYGTSGQYPGGFYADANGNLFGTGQMGGSNGEGTLFKITGAGYVVPEPASAMLFTSAIALASLRRRCCRR